MENEYDEMTLYLRELAGMGLFMWLLCILNVLFIDNVIYALILDFLLFGFSMVLFHIVGYISYIVSLRESFYDKWRNT